MYPNNEKQIVTESVNTATDAPDSGRIPFFCIEPLPGESASLAKERFEFLDNAAEAIFTLGNCNSSFFKAAMMFNESDEDFDSRCFLLQEASRQCLEGGSGNLQQQIEQYARRKDARLQLNELHEQANEIQLDLLPFFAPQPLPNESKEKTKQRLQFINDAAAAIAGTANKIGTGIQEQILLFIKQNNLFAEMKEDRDRESFEYTIWEMFEALIRDEISAPDWEIRSDACMIYRWLQKVTNTIYPLQEA